MDLGLAGKSAFITGGGQGIGAAFAKRLSMEGVRVAIADIDSNALAATAGELSSDADPVLIQTDLSNGDGVDRALDQLLDELGVPDILINNVGVSTSRAFMDLDDAAWEATFNLNFMSYVRVARRLLPAMASEPGRAVVNVASDLAKQPEAVPADYGAMKAAVLYLTKVLAIDFAPNVRSNAVLPGPVWTGLWSRPGGLMDRMAETYGTDRDDALQRYLHDRQLTMGISDPEDVATLVAYMVSPLGRRINGAAFDIGGTIRGLL